MTFDEARKYLGLPGDNTKVISQMLRMLADDLDSGTIATSSNAEVVQLRFNNDVLYKVEVDLNILSTPRRVDSFQEHEPRFKDAMGPGETVQPKLGGLL